jgi:dihydroorotase
MTKVLITGGRIVDPVQGIDAVGHVLIDGGRIKKIYRGGAAPRVSADRTIDARGMYVLPGLVDMHVHLREPGFEHKETIASGTMAAVRGGFTSVCCMPNTSPVNDNAGITEYIRQKAARAGACAVYPIGAITKGQEGKELAEMGMMIEEGCVAFSDDGRPVASSLLMRRALEYAQTFGATIISHAEDPELVEGGVMNEGLRAYMLGLRGIPKAAEEIMVYRDVALAELTGGKLHIAHVSTEGAVRIIRDAKKRGVNVTAETCPHYFSITDEAVEGFNTNAKVNPPLRTEWDIDAIKEGLGDGTIDAIATDHAPHHKNEKGLQFELAPSGISGLETALPLALELVRTGVLDMTGLVRAMASRPAAILGLPVGTLAEGADADLVVVDAEREYEIDPERFVSLGKNTPFAGWRVRGMALVTIARGKVYEWE